MFTIKRYIHNQILSETHLKSWQEVFNLLESKQIHFDKSILTKKNRIYFIRNEVIQISSTAIGTIVNYEIKKTLQTS